MQTTMMVLRVLHIGTGVVWAGTIVFFAFFLEPAVRAAGPDGMKVMREIQSRRFPIVMPILGIVAVLTGLDLIRRLFPGGPSAWVATTQGQVLVAGAAAAIIVLLIGIFIVLPIVKRMPGLVQRMMTADEGSKAKATADVMAARDRLTLLARVNAGLVIVTIISMAVARYAG